MLAYVHFLLYFEGTDLATLAHLVATVARYAAHTTDTRTFYKKIGFALLYDLNPHYYEQAPIVGLKSYK